MTIGATKKYIDGSEWVYHPIHGLLVLELGYSIETPNKIAIRSPITGKTVVFDVQNLSYYDIRQKWANVVSLKNAEQLILYEATVNDVDLEALIIGR